MKPEDVVIPPGWEQVYERWHYAAAVRDGDHLRCSGVIGVGPDGTISPDAETQFRHSSKMNSCTRLIRPGRQSA